ncbi:MAG: hypothetical protein IT162_01435 [Bryobacterales bacterium]|nr:hypothetical protein [Bryobacterales bacterium]
MRRILLVSAAMASAAWTQEIAVEAVTGEGAIHNVQDRSVPAPRVRVVDRRGQPVEGAFVTFRLPDAGPGARFAGGRIFTVTADVHGEAQAPAMQPVPQLGSWDVRVTATHKGEFARLSIAQINAAPVDAVVAPSGGGPASVGRPRRMLLVAAVLAGGAAAASLGLVGRGSSAGAARSGGVSVPPVTAPAPGLSITAGSTSFSAP